ncbi:MAG: hydroxymethylbilane synthase [Desulfovibrionaceae bacterium]|nr:hydroxymethylbilane synthase [Desulfovibrionaceae bacterium]MBF0512923.1 hydroxymethylbilane synthase [Desulfovibrionaceae bacterium]
MTQCTIATRGSQLALWQANHIAALLRERHPGLTVSLLVLKTTGDKILDVPLAKVGGKGLFVKEIEDALLDGRADLAVHSLKDVPAELPAGLTLGVVPRREEPADVFLSVDCDSPAALPRAATVGTSSLRRQAQLLALRPDLTIESLRGNLDTRVRKLLEGVYAAIVVAAAGLNRLGLTAPKRFVLGPPDFLPAVGQGALGLEYRESDAATAALVSFLNDPDSRDATDAERGFLAGLDGGCQAPIAAHAVMLGSDSLRLTGLVADLTGARVVRREIVAPRERAREAGLSLARTVLDAGGQALMDELYAHDAG